MHYFGCDLGERGQHEFSGGHQGMGYDEIVLVHDPVSVEKDVEIDRPRSPPDSSFSAQCLFNG